MVVINSCKKIYLADPSHNILTQLNGIDTSTVSYTIHAKDYQELSFEVDRYIVLDDGTEIESSGYDDIGVYMYLYLEDIGFFQMQQPTFENDGVREYKTIIAYSCEKEFEDKDIGIFKINTGEDGSYERLDESNLDELGYAKNYITFYRSNESGLTDYSLLHLILEHVPGWTVSDEDVDESLWYKKATFDEENINAYALLTSTIAPKFECIITFDILNRKIGAIAKEHLDGSYVDVTLPDGTTKRVTYNNDYDTSIFVGFRNLANSVSVTTDEDSVYTQFTCAGDDDLTFEDVNFGQSKVIDLSYFTCQPYMSDETASKVSDWQLWCDANRDTYISLSKEWADTDSKKTEIEDRVPSDMDDYDQYSDMDTDLLNQNLEYYQALLESLQISVDTRSDSEKYTGTGDDKKYNPVKKDDGTVDDDYYLDLLKQEANGYGGYYTYFEIITYVIPNIEIAIYNKGKTEANQKDYVTSYETNWELYGITELQNKKETYEMVISTLADYKLPYSESGTTVDKETYEKKYSEYWNASNHLAALQPYLDALLKEQEELQTKLDSLQDSKNELAKQYLFSYTDDDGNAVYNYNLTEDEVNLINALIHNIDYTNSNIIKTSVDTTVTTIDREKELFDDSVEKLSEVSQPQFKFSVDLDNLLRLEEFKDWVADCQLYKFIRLGIRDDYSVKVRIVGISYNPCEVTPDLTLEFSNMITSRSGRSDLTDILDSENNRGSRNSITLGASTNYDTDFATTLLQTMIKTNLFQKGVSNVVGDIEISGTATIDEAQIKNLFTEYVEAGEINVGYLSGKEADFEKFYSQYGLFDSLVAKELEADIAKFGLLTTDELKTEIADIGYLTADEIDALYLKTKNLEAENLKLGYLTADEIKADIAKIGYLTADNADLAYAKIDLANVADGTIDSALIKDGAIIDAKISNVSANKLFAGTIDASKIEVKNLNADNLTVGTINGKMIGNSTVDLDKLSEEVPTKEYLDSVQNNLQNQIDGAIETFTIDVVPTLTNEPAVNWSDNTTKAKHVGDICYVLNDSLEENGYCYRFANTGSLTAPVYEWVLIKDSDVTKALQDLVDMQGDICGLKTFETETNKWKSETDSSLESVISNVTKVETDLGTKVDNTTFNEVKQAVGENSASITKLSNTIDSKADGSTVDTLSKTVNEVKQTADNNTSTISNLSKTVDVKADGSTVDAIETRTSALEQNLEGFQSTVSSTYVTQTTYNNKVSDLETGISDAQSTANTASVNASSAVSTANVANTNASNAVTTANQASSDASSAMSKANDLEERANSGEFKGEKGDKGDDGTSITIKSTIVEYQVSSSGTTTPTGIWQTTISSTSAGQYLWARTTVTYSDGTSTVSYSISRNGSNGTNGTNGKDGANGTNGKDGISPTVTSTTTEYVQSTSGTNTPTSGWSTTPPTATAGQYIWTKIIITYSDGQKAISYGVVKNGVDGEQGEQGVSVVSQKNQYYLSTSNTSTTGGSWSDTPPVLTATTYIWTRLCYTLSDGNTKYSTAVLDKALNDVVVRVIKAETNIAQNKEDITLRATKTEVATAKSEAISTASKDATTKADNALSSAKTYADAQIKVSADEISSKVVNKDGIVSAINQTAETIKISADKVNLDGYTTFTDLSTPGKTTISGSNITTGALTITDDDGNIVFKADADNKTVEMSGNSVTIGSSTATEAVNELSTSVGQIKSTAEANTASITKLTTTVNSKADASTVTTLSNTVNTVKQTADKNTSSISSLTSNVDNATEDISALETKQSTLEQSLDGFKTTVSSTYVTKTAYDSKVTDLESDIDTATTTANTASANASTALSTANASVASVAVEYYVSTSATALSGGSWSTTQPTWTDGSYIWARTKTTTKGGTVSYSNAACVTGATGTQGTKGDKGDTGATGNGVKSIVPQYYLSTSSTTRTGGSWSSAEPTWKSGTYIWTRSYITWTNGTTSTTTPVLATTLNTLNTRVTTAETNIEQNKNDITLRATKTEVATAKSEAISTASKDATTKADNALSSAKTYADAQIKVSADSITSTVASTYATQDALSSAESKIQQNADNIELKVNKDGIISTINQSAEGISISADKINLDGVVTINDYIKMNEDGSLVATNGTFTGVVNATSGSFTGKIDASTGKIGGWTIGSTMLYNGTNSMSSTTAGTYIGTNGITQVSTDGCLNIQNGNILARNAKREAKSGYQFTKTRWMMPDGISANDGNAGIIFFNESSKNLMQVQKTDKTNPFYIERDGTVHIANFSVNELGIVTQDSNSKGFLYVGASSMYPLWVSNPTSNTSLLYAATIDWYGNFKCQSADVIKKLTCYSGMNVNGNHLVLAAGVGIYATNTSGVAANMINMNMSNNNVAINWGMYNKMLDGTDNIKASSTNIYAGTDINFITTKGVNFKPYFRAGMSVTISKMYTTGYISSSSGTVYFFVPLARPYTGGTVSVTVGGMIIRQQNKYLYGSSSSTEVTPKSYGYSATENGVRVYCVMKNTTNVTYNNDTCGLELSTIAIKFS